MLKSTSWINIFFQSQLNQSQINYSFNDNDAEGDVILASSGALLFIIYLSLIYEIIKQLLKKYNYDKIIQLYKKYFCGLMVQLLIISTQIVQLGIMLQIVYLFSSSESLEKENYIVLKIILSILNTLLGIGIFIFLYKENNNLIIILDFSETLSIQDVNQSFLQTQCYSATWFQKNYNLTLFFKDAIIIPTLVVSFQSIYFAQLFSIFFVESVYLILLSYLRPYKENSDNIFNIINSIILLVILILKLGNLINIDGIKFSNNTNNESSSKSVKTFQCIETTQIVLCFLLLLNIQLAQIFKIIKKRQICESNLPLTKLIDPLRQLRISPFGGYEIQNPSMFKIREEKLNEKKFLQSYKKYRASGGFSCGTFTGIPRSSISSLSPPQLISPPIKHIIQSKSRFSDQLNSQFILNPLNDTNQNGSINNSINVNNFTVFDQSRQKTSILLVESILNKDAEQKFDINQIKELKEEYTSNSNQNIFKANQQNLFIQSNQPIKGKNLNSSLNYSSSNSSSQDSDEIKSHES